MHCVTGAFLSSNAFRHRSGNFLLLNTRFMSAVDTSPLVVTPLTKEKPVFHKQTSSLKIEFWTSKKGKRMGAGNTSNIEPVLCLDRVRKTECCCTLCQESTSAVEMLSNNEHFLHRRAEILQKKSEKRVYQSDQDRIATQHFPLEAPDKLVQRNHLNRAIKR
jgi:hypothetical protein